MIFNLVVLAAIAAVLASIASGFSLTTSISGLTSTRCGLAMGPLSSLSNVVKKNAFAKQEYDYIIVGGGTAGCVLANRLSADASKRVLVVEAGSDKFNNPLVKIPAGIIKLFKTEFDWNFDSEREASTKDREIYLCRGKVLGGSSCINVLLYHRGDREDYEQWEALSGEARWGLQQVLPYFKKSQDDFRGESASHGLGGELSVSEVRYQNPLSRAYLQACAEAGFPANPDFNDWSRAQEGAGRFQVMERNGARCSAASGFLKPALRRKNLRVVTRATVHKVVFGGPDGKQTQGVELTLGDKAEAQQVQVRLAAGGEVLLTGGSINSPQLLMLSGIGPSAELGRHGIPTLVDAPAVGQGLQDHPASVVSYEVPPEHRGISVTSKIRIPGTRLTNPLVALQWMLRRSGPFTSVGCDHGGFFHTQPQAQDGQQQEDGAGPSSDSISSTSSTSSASCDLQMRFLPARALSPDGMGTFSKFRENNVQLDGFSFQSIVSRPQSRGQVTLRSPSALDPPRIRTGYFTDAEGMDLRTLREGLRLSRKLAQQQAFRPYLGAEVYPGADVQTDEQLDDYIRSFVHTSNALVGTCAMGKDPSTSVVHPADLRVHGVRGLRVADASVMPKIPGGQTGAPTIMIAEQAADMLLQESGTAP